MRSGLSFLLLLFACGETAPAPEPTASEPIAAEAPAAAETQETAPPEAEPERPETTELGEVADPSGQATEVQTAADSEETGAAPQGAPLLTAPNPEARVDIEGRINHAGIIRLSRALGLPAPLHLHGRPFAVPDADQVISLVSFLAPGESGEEDQMHTEVWLLEHADGSLFRVGAARVPYQPVPTYNDIAVGGEDLATAIVIKAQSIEDFDADGAMEYQVVIELVDAVVCGVGPLTRRYQMIFNLPTMSTALDVRTLESGGGAVYFRSTVLWGDENNDEHPDIDLRIRTCSDWSDETRECTSESDAHVMYMWSAENDQWVHQSALPSRAPCGEEE
ncbi:MAG: hypothetical protein AB8H86_05895 [Polyangiales bacterium]